MIVLAVGAAARLSAERAGQTPLTARQVVDRIRAQVGVPARTQTVDLFNAGDPDTPVTGIALTMMATFDVLQRAAAKKQNLIITHEPTFYSHTGDYSELEREQDPVFRAKMAFVRANNLVVWRFHDSWHDRRPDGILTGMIRALGWEKWQRTDTPNLFTMPETTLGALAKSVKDKLDARTLRFIGDPTLKVTNVSLSPGFGGFATNRRLLQRDDVEVEVLGEGHEWEIASYAADAVTARLAKGLIVVGHIPSEQAGMDECARWMKTFVSEVPIEFVAAREAFEVVR
jgi:putative NIF3 family GTP cyclohydrolase 1 type 2